MSAKQQQGAAGCIVKPDSSAKLHTCQLCAPTWPQVLSCRLYDYDIFNADDEIGRCCRLGGGRWWDAGPNVLQSMGTLLNPPHPTELCRVELSIADLPRGHQLDDWFEVHPPHKEQPASNKYLRTVRTKTGGLCMQGGGTCKGAAGLGVL